MNMNKINLLAHPIYMHIQMILSFSMVAFFCPLFSAYFTIEGKGGEGIFKQKVLRWKKKSLVKSKNIYIQ